MKINFKTRIPGSDIANISCCCNNNLKMEFFVLGVAILGCKDCNLTIRLLSNHNEEMYFIARISCGKINLYWSEQKQAIGVYFNDPLNPAFIQMGPEIELPRFITKIEKLQLLL